MDGLVEDAWGLGRKTMKMQRVSCPRLQKA